tara:strand:+ start:477 stop:728 length:252 start_codon:yes stop_codon:yes gene_type:complete
MSKPQNNISNDVSIFFDGCAHDFFSIYKEDTKKCSSFDKLRNCPLFLYSKEFLEGLLKKAGCFEISEIVEIDREYFATIKKLL